MSMKSGEEESRRRQLIQLKALTKLCFAAACKVSKRAPKARSWRQRRGIAGGAESSAKLKALQLIRRSGGAWWRTFRVTAPHPTPHLCAQRRIQHQSFWRRRYLALRNQHPAKLTASAHWWLRHRLLSIRLHKASAKA
jgi:hypothetical protein